MLSYLLISLTCVTAEASLGAPPPSSETYTKCAPKTPQWDDIDNWQCKSNAPLSGEWCCNQCNLTEACPPTDPNAKKCHCEKIPAPKPKPEVMCPADFPICQKSDGKCASHVPGNTKQMDNHCTKDYKFVMCPANFPICYTDGDCVLQACKDGLKDGSTCDHWKEFETWIQLGKKGHGRTRCIQDYSSEVYGMRPETNLDSEEYRKVPSPRDRPNLTDLKACYPKNSPDPVEYCKNECEKNWLCGGFTVHRDRDENYQIMLKKIHLPDGSSVFEHKEYFRRRPGFTTYYVKAQMPEPTTRELFA